MRELLDADDCEGWSLAVCPKDRTFSYLEHPDLCVSNGIHFGSEKMEFLKKKGFIVFYFVRIYFCLVSIVCAWNQKPQQWKLFFLAVAFHDCFEKTFWSYLNLVYYKFSHRLFSHYHYCFMSLWISPQVTLEIIYIAHSFYVSKFSLVWIINSRSFNFQQSKCPI